MTLTLATPEQQAERAAAKAVYMNSTYDGHECNANGIYTDPVTGKQYLSRARMNGLEAQGNADERRYRPNGSRGYCKGI